MASGGTRGMDGVVDQMLFCRPCPALSLQENSDSLISKCLATVCSLSMPHATSTSLVMRGRLLVYQHQSII